MWIYVSSCNTHAYVYFWVLDGMGSPGPEVTGGFKPHDVKAEKAESFLLLVTYPPHVSP